MRSRERINILGLPIDTGATTAVLAQIERFIAVRIPHQVNTVNPEYLVTAQTNQRFRAILANSELSLPDGIGIRAAATFNELAPPIWQPARFMLSVLVGGVIGMMVVLRHPRLRRPLPETITGTDLVDQLATLGQNKRWRFYLVGGAPGIAEQAARRLRALYPEILIVGAESGLKPTDRLTDHATVAPLVRAIRRARPDILLVAFGAPRQNVFIDRYRRALGVPVMIGVGGAFNFIAGKVARAPRAVRALGLEWLWRLRREPHRWRRIITAVLVFPWLVFWSKQRA